jgi:hypothetical protein
MPRVSHAELTTEQGASVRMGQAVPGIRLKRDNWVSVRYAEELNSATSSGILQRTDRHGILGQKSTDFQLSL